MNHTTESPGYSSEPPPPEETAHDEWTQWLLSATPLELVDQLVASAQEVGERRAHQVHGSEMSPSSAEDEVTEIRDELSRRLRAVTWVQIASFTREEKPDA